MRDDHKVQDLSPETLAALADAVRLCLDEREFDWDPGFPYRCNRDLGHRGDHWCVHPRDNKRFGDGAWGCRWPKKREKR